MMHHTINVSFGLYILVYSLIEEKTLLSSQQIFRDLLEQNKWLGQKIVD